MSYQDLPVSMHPRYSDFLEFMRECPYRKTPSTLETAFWAWLKLSALQNNVNELLDPQNAQIQNLNLVNEVLTLKQDLDRLHRERDSFQQQCAAMASENERLNDELMQLKRNIAIALDYGAVTERGDACLAIDGGNL